jgi:nucleoside-diphosphate-sugar epimerase
LRVIAVTGGTGFTGPFVVRALASRFPDAHLRCLIRSSSDVSCLDGSSVELITGDLRDEAALGTFLKGADTIVNVASLGFDWVDPLIAAIRRSSISRGVFISTTAMLTRLPVRSAPARLRAEGLVRDSGLAWTILRPTMIYGTPRDRNIARLIRFVRRSPIVPIAAVEALQQPIHVEDVAAAVAAALGATTTVGRAYNIAGREPLTLEKMVRETIAAVGYRRAVVRLPYAPMMVGAAICSHLVAKPPISVEQMKRLGEDKSIDYSAATEDFGFAPRSFQEGVRQEAAMFDCSGSKWSPSCCS